MYYILPSFLIFITVIFNRSDTGNPCINKNYKRDSVKKIANTLSNDEFPGKMKYDEK